MKKKYFFALVTCSCLLAGSIEADEVMAGNAYRYFMLYKNSETYKELHKDDSEKEQPEQIGPKLDGWGNLVDEPPPTAPDDYGDDNWERQSNDMTLPGNNYQDGSSNRKLEQW